MGLNVRYRFVDFGTVFTSDPGIRGEGAAKDSPSVLFSNELATDVGGTCWGANEPLSVIDHHFSRDGQFPSASAAVLHKAKLIHGRFGRFTGEVLWLVTHKQPDFDAFCSMYLARWIAEDGDAVLDWQPYGLHPEGWLDLPARPRIDWFNPDLRTVPQSHRWPLLLASYASILDNSRPLACPRGRALHSVLYAAMKRGRDYRNESGGAREFFDEVRSVVQEKQLNPLFDSILEGSERFAPELDMLDREAEAYGRDMRRARKAIVYLPESEAPSPTFFKTPKQVARLQVENKSAEINTENLSLADTFRIPTDGVYLRDPECLLFKEWARLDLENSSLGAGFEFTGLSCSNGRADAIANKSDYGFSIDPERANGRHLYTVWSRLQTKEVEALRASEQELVTAVGESRPGRGSASRSGTLDTLLSDPWFGGQSHFGTVVTTPKRGTTIGAAGVRGDLRDDPVAEAVRSELESSIYSAESLVAGPQMTISDFAGAKDGKDAAPRRFDLNAASDVPPPAENYFRFARIGLRSDVPITTTGISGRGLAQQIGETLWQVLYPEIPGATPSDFAERHLVVAANYVGVWGDRGVAVAQKYAPPRDVARQQAGALENDFSRIVSLTREIDQLVAERESQSSMAGAMSTPNSAAGAKRRAELLQNIVTRAEDLTHRAAQVKHALTMPDRELLRRFYEAIGVDQLLTTLRDLNHSATEHLRRVEAAEQSRRMEERAEVVSKVQSKLEWLEVFIVGFVAIEIIELITRHIQLGDKIEDAMVLLGGPVFLIFAAWLLKPWKRKGLDATSTTDKTGWILIALVVACLAGWLAGLLRIWNK